MIEVSETTQRSSKGNLKPAQSKRASGISTNANRTTVASLLSTNRNGVRAASQLEDGLDRRDIADLTIDYRGPEWNVSGDRPDERGTSSPPNPGSQIDIQLGRTITAGPMRDRHDIALIGLVTAEQPITAVSLIVADEVRAISLYGPAAGSQQAFRLVLAQNKDLALGLTSFDVVVRTRDGHERRTAFKVATDQNEPRTARVVAGPVCELPLPPSVSIPVLLDVELAGVDRNGILHVTGWSAALAQIVVIQVFVGEQRVGSAQLGPLREDIAATYPAYPNARMSGFTLSAAVPEGTPPKSVAVEAIDLSGAVSRVVVPIEFGIVFPEASAPVEAQVPMLNAQRTQDFRRAIFLHCDEATLSTDGELVVSGWAVCATGIATVGVRLGRELVGNAELGLPRQDVAGEYARIPQAHFSGFRSKHQISAPVSGVYELALVAHNGLDETQELVLKVIATDPVRRTSQPAPAVPLDPHEFRFQIDNPVVIDDVVPEPVVRRMVIEGWALARSGVVAINIFLDGRSLGQAYYGTARRDVEAAFPDWTDSLRCGYIFHCPPRALESGAHTIQLQLEAKSGRTLETEFRIDVQQTQDGEDYAQIRRHMSRAEIDLFQDILIRLSNRPHFRLLLAATGPINLEKLAATLRTLGGQAYSDWRLLIAAGTTKPKDLLETADRAGVRERVSIVPADPASDVLIRASADSAPCLVGVLFPGDELGCDALAEFAIARGVHADAQFFYADETRVSPTSHAREPFFKPAWSPDLLLSTNYIGRPWFATTELLTEAGITLRSLLVPQGDYDAVLRCTELASRIHHLPKLLCRRDDGEASDPESERRVLQSASGRRGIAEDLLPGCVPGTWRLKRCTPVAGKVSIIIPTCAAQGHVATCLETLRGRTAYRNFEIICIDNIPPALPEWKELIRKRADKIVDIPEAFNWSRFNNRAMEHAEGEYLLFLNDDIAIETEHADWLDALLEHAHRPEVGIVGPQLLYPNRKVQHAGIFLTTLGAGRHAFRFLAEDDPGYFGLALTQRNVIAVTGACMMIRREVFERIGRFDEAHEVVNNDVDCCLRSWRAGLSVVYTPYAQLIHHELASRAKIKDIYDAGHFAKQWRTLYATGDPYFSPRLTKFADEYRPDTEPARLICAGRPLFRMDEIQCILAVKLDHIGDLLTALPALRRLRRHFPTARICLLASASARAFLAGEDCVDELIEFDFFHARSGLGEKGLTEDDLRALGERLTPYRFDLAIDLRKQVETRHVLKYVPARLRAGYDNQGRFPWLDVVLEWEGDNQLHRKRSHISDDLLRLVDAVATAGEDDRTILPQATGGVATLPAGLPAKASALFSKPVVAVHPGVGAVMRQWMPEYFATVIDLLIEKNGVNVVLVGGPDEAELAGQVLKSVVNRNSVVSLAGRTSLAELTALLGACALYLGNNSGPKHIAALLGVPTVGIHSGVVDAAEWGPVGPRAIAVQRNMVCSPCYLVKPEDCVRDMACLKRLEPAVVHQYCEMMLARAVQLVPAAEAKPGDAATKPARGRERAKRVARNECRS
jgi:O-antigen biosynthesis protein